MQSISKAGSLLINQVRILIVSKLAHHGLFDSGFRLFRHNIESVDRGGGGKGVSGSSRKTRAINRAKRSDCPSACGLCSVHSTVTQHRQAWSSCGCVRMTRGQLWSPNIYPEYLRRGANAKLGSLMPPIAALHRCQAGKGSRRRVSFLKGQRVDVYPRLYCKRGRPAEN